MALTGICPRCEKKILFPECPNCGGTVYGGGEEADNHLPAWICLKCHIAQTHITCPICSALISAERFSDKRSFPGCMGLIIWSGLIALAISVLGFVLPLDKFFAPADSTPPEAAKSNSSAKPGKGQKQRHIGDSARTREKVVLQPAIDWDSRYRLLYGQYLTQFHPPPAGQRITIALKSGNRMEGTLRALDGENLTLELGTVGVITVGADQFTMENGRTFFARYSAEFLARQQVQREQQAQPGNPSR